jgi:polyhydroxyalkanoate synthesis repressor PhaR
MVRLIKRYGGGSRKLYDTEESRYVGLDEVARFIRGGQELKVVDSATGEDVTAQTLAQVILEGERRGFSLAPTALLHDVIRKGGHAFSKRVEALQQGVDRIMSASVERLPRVRQVKSEMSQLRSGIDRLERSVKDLEKNGGHAKRSTGKKRKNRSSR